MSEVVNFHKTSVQIGVIRTAEFCGGSKIPHRPVCRVLIQPLKFCIFKMKGVPQDLFTVSVSVSNYHFAKFMDTIGCHGAVHVK